MLVIVWPPGTNARRSGARLEIFICLTLGIIWHKVFFSAWGWSHELDLGSLGTMWNMLTFPVRMPGDLAGHRVTRPEDLEQCEFMQVIAKSPSRGFKPCWSMLVVGPPRAMWAWWALQDLDPNLGPGTYACYSLNWSARSIAIQGGQRCQSCRFPRPKVAQPKPGAFLYQVGHGALTVRHERIPDS